MGFTTPPNTLYDTMLFINNVEGYPWSFEKTKPCREKAIEGKIVGLYIKLAKEYKGTRKVKLHILLRDDEGHTFCLRSSINTVFVRGFLLKAKQHFSEGKVNVPVIILSLIHI